MGFLSFFSSVSCFFLLLLSLHLFFAKRGVRILNRLLSVVFFYRFGQLLVFLLVTAGEQNIFPFFYQAFAPLYYAGPICFYLYVVCFINGRTELRKSDWFHFVPVFLAVVHILPGTGLSQVRWDKIGAQIAQNMQLFVTERSGIFPAWFYYLGRPFMVLVYLSATWMAVIKSKLNSSRMDADARTWIMFFVRAATFFQLASFLPLLTWSLDHRLLNVSFVLLNCMVLLVILVFIMHHPKLFYGYLFVSVDLNKGEESVVLAELPVLMVPATVSVKKIIPLSDQLSPYPDLLRSFMETEQPYLQANFQIVDLATALNMPVHHCSSVINGSFDKNFRDWINGYRIESFIAEYPLKSNKMTIEAVAYESGFKSLATFYNAFKKEKGLMPKAYFSGKKSD